MNTYSQMRKGEMNCMKDVVLDEVKKELNWKERMIVSIFKNTYMKVYNMIRIETINRLLK